MLHEQYCWGDLKMKYGGHSTQPTWHSNFLRCVSLSLAYHSTSICGFHQILNLAGTSNFLGHSSLLGD